MIELKTNGKMFVGDTHYVLAKDIVSDKIITIYQTKPDTYQEITDFEYYSSDLIKIYSGELSIFDADLITEKDDPSNYGLYFEDTYRVIADKKDENIYIYLYDKNDNLKKTINIDMIRKEFRQE